MASKQKSEKIDILDLLRILRREYDSDDPVFTMLTSAIRTIEELRIENEDILSSLEGLRAAQRDPRDREASRGLPRDNHR